MNFQQWKLVFGPGYLTSEDEERETWTAESLRVSQLKASAFGSGPDERLRRYTFQRLHHDLSNEIALSAM
jgi:hypothetical protein